MKGEEKDEEEEKGRRRRRGRGREAEEEEREGGWEGEEEKKDGEEKGRSRTGRGREGEEYRECCVVLDNYPSLVREMHAVTHHSLLCYVDFSLISLHGSNHLLLLN